MLNSKQRARLRSLANGIEPIFQVGKGNLGPSFFVQVEQALEVRELIKIRVLETAMLSPREACTEICEAVGAEPVQVIGHCFVIFKKSIKQPKIEL